MKRLLAATVVLFTIWINGFPITAQDSRVPGADERTVRNPVSYAKIGAFSDGNGVWLEWQTAFESDNLGFHVYRIAAGEKVLASPALIPGVALRVRGDQITGGSYSLFDRFGDGNSIYVVESLNSDGRTHDSTLIEVKPVADLTPFAGISLAQLSEQARNASPVVTGSESVLPADLAAEVENNRLPPDPNMQRWVAAQPGVKIGVKTEGMYRVTRADLQANGFDVNAPSDRWQLYVNGVEQAIAVGTGGGYIEFYGQGIDTLESETQTYFLVVGAQGGRRIKSTVRRRVGGSVMSESYSQTFYKKERTFYTSAILNGDAENVFGSTIGSNVRTINFDLSEVDFNGAGAALDLTIQGATRFPHEIRVSLNDVYLGIVTGGNFDSMVGRFDLSASALREGTNALQLQSQAGATDVNVFDSMRINFPRRYRAVQDRISFYVPNYEASYVGGFASPDVRIFDTTNPDAPLLISNLSVEQNGGSHRVHLPANRGRVLYGTTDTGLLQPASISQNSPSTLSTAGNVGNLIIISHKNFLPQAETWATYRRSQGLTVKVVDSEDVFDEFNYGVLRADSIREFLRYAKNSWQTPPNYVLLIGDATYDPKNYFGSNANYVPTRMIDTARLETGSDETLADFDGDGLGEISVGRIPARNAAEATLIYQKTLAFEQSLTQGLARGVIFASDRIDGYDFEEASNRWCDELPTGAPCIKINRNQPNANAALVSEMNGGRFIVNYTGHGDITLWGGNEFFHNTHASSLTNGNNVSLFTVMSCLNGYYVNPSDTISELLLKNPNGGAAAVWASSGLTAPDEQDVMATRFYSQIGLATAPNRVGDLIKDAKAAVPAGSGVRLTWALLGDPTLKIR